MDTTCESSEQSNQYDGLHKYRTLCGDVCCNVADKLQVTRELTNSLRSVENRKELKECDIELASNLACGILEKVESSKLMTSDQQNIESSIQLLVELIRLLRNACADCLQNQLAINRLCKPLVHRLVDHVGDCRFQSESELVFLRCSVQFASNAVAGCPDNAAVFWNSFFPHFRKLMEYSDETLKQYTCCLCYNCIANDTQRTCLHELVNSQCGQLTTSALLDYLERNDCEWGLYIVEKYIEYTESMERIWPSLSNSQKSTVLSIATSRLQQSTCDDGRCVENIAPANMLFLAKEFITMSRKLPGQLTNSNTSDVEVQEELTIARQMLTCLCLATTNRSAYEQLHDLTDLFSAAIDLLKNVHLLGQSADNLLSVRSKLSTSQSPDVAANSAVHGIRSDIMRLICSLVYQNPANQNLVRECDGIPLILEHTNNDCNNPYIAQWSVLAVRNLCEGNELNQQTIADLQCRGLSPSTAELLNSLDMRDLMNSFSSAN